MTIRRPLTGPAIALAAGIVVPSGPVIAQDQEIVVEASIYRVEIERILGADGRTVNLSPRQVAEAMARIPRGTAPDDFWASYRNHLGAWQELAVASANVRSDPVAIATLEEAVNSTFDEVEQIARRYGARLPDARE